MKEQLLKELKTAQVNFPLCLAPMVGLSHVALREVIRSYMPLGAKTIWPTEMLSSKKLPFENLSKVPEAMRAETEDNLVPQILGNEEKSISESVKKLEDWGAIGIDINMGCPVQKALKHNYGVALMGDMKYAADVVAMTVKSTKLPVSVKLRAVGREAADLDYLKRFTQGLIEAGASWICLHPRSAEQVRRGSADWSQIQFLKENCGVSILGNGDIQTLDDVLRMKQQTNCDLIMSGRGLAARPWLVWQLGRHLEWMDPVAHQGRKLPQTPEEEAMEYGRCLVQLIDLCVQFFGENLAMRKVRFYVRMTSVWLDFGHTVVSCAHKAQSTEEMKKKFQNLFSQNLKMFPYTELRQ